MYSVSKRLLQTVIITTLLTGYLMPGFKSVHAQSLKPVYWKEKLFYIPYQGQQREKFLQQVSKVQLMLSRDGISDWQILQEAKPNVQGFSYHVPGDGEYWFTLRHLDRLGRPTSQSKLTPQLRMIVDTKNPVLEIDAALDLTGNVVIQYETTDLNLNHNSLSFEVSADEKNWTRINQETPDVSQPDKIVGSVHWRPPIASNAISIRARVSDQADHRSEVIKQVNLKGPSLTGLASTPPLTSKPKTQSQATQNPFQEMQSASAQSWPSNNQLSETPKNTVPAHIESSASGTLPPPILNPYTTASSKTSDQRTPAHFIAENSSSQSPELNSLAITPLDESPVSQEPVNTPNTINDPAENWSATEPLKQSAIRSVNSNTFDVEYDLDSVGPWGLAKVELWGTHDSGQTWQLYTTDPDNRSPLRVTVPGSGQYGFRIVVHGANGAAAITPVSGDQPELTVAVDLLPPKLVITNAVLGEGHFGNHLAIAWEATDSNLENRPITISYSSHPNGPWTTVAARLQNSGKYVWQIERHIPARFYLRIEALDEAGNVATHYYEAPINLPRAKPTGTLRGIRPVANNPEPLRAAFPVEKR